MLNYTPPVCVDSRLTQEAQNVPATLLQRSGNATTPTEHFDNIVGTFCVSWGRGTSRSLRQEAGAGRLSPESEGYAGFIALGRR